MSKALRFCGASRRLSHGVHDWKLFRHRVSSQSINNPTTSANASFRQMTTSNAGSFGTGEIDSAPQTRVAVNRPRASSESYVPKSNIQFQSATSPAPKKSPLVNHEENNLKSNSPIASNISITDENLDADIFSNTDRPKTKPFRRLDGMHAATPVKSMGRIPSHSNQNTFQRSQSDQITFDSQESVSSFLQKVSKDLVVAYSPWIEVSNISPVSSLESMVSGINTAMENIILYGRNGILDMNAILDAETIDDLMRRFDGVQQKEGRKRAKKFLLSQLPQLSSIPEEEKQNTEPAGNWDQNNFSYFGQGGGWNSLDDKLEHRESSGADKMVNLPEESTVSSPWIRKCKLKISLTGRPCGWLIQLADTSIARALLKHETIRVRCGWKSVNIRPLSSKEVAKSDRFMVRCGQPITNATVRVEDCPMYVSEYDLLKLFSRFDLADSNRQEAVEQWDAAPEILSGKKNPNGIPTSKTFLVHFASAAWARAAIREFQGTTFPPKKFSHHPEVSYSPPIIMMQYPKQIL